MLLAVATTPESIKEDETSIVECEKREPSQSLPGSVEPMDRDNGNIKQVVPLPEKTIEGDGRRSEQDTAPEPEPTVEKVPVRVFSVAMPVRVGGALLAFCAGFVNAVAFHALASFVSHQTGTLSKVALGWEDREKADPTYSLSLLLSFVVGSTVCGCFIGKNTIHFGLAMYDFGLISVTCLLLAATFISDKKFASCLAAAACGLQNGLATSWGGAVIRTTHVTGLFTDVGLLIGRILSILARKRCGKNFDAFDQVEVADDLSKLSVLLSIGVAFFVGVFVGAHMHNALKRHAFLIPAGIEGTIGVAYFIYRVVILHHSVFSAEEMEIVDMPENGLSEICINGRSLSPDELADHGVDSVEIAPSISQKDFLHSASDGVERKPSKSITPSHNVVSVARSSILASSSNLSLHGPSSGRSSPNILTTPTPFHAHDDHHSPRSNSKHER